MNKFVWLGLALISGMVLPIQASLNAKVGKVLESGVAASLLSFVVGGLSLVMYIVFSSETINTQAFKSIPALGWIAGLLGAFYVTIVIFTIPRIGPALTFSLIVAGQMIVALILEHFNLLVAQQHSINLPRILGMLLIIGGVILIRKF
ncbi:DMT family transporter [Pseudochryseolinea flava]|uniref:EamA-like transporter family protein n=1 Tax=Pseudochryseolinea flava TaxID=2059302 RepID=A0A364XY60_9BACT|nr:DMT family transporter [Pseudochryseolinea flava]RAV99235.1 EamA-like transporter family protein [Pseudochryseolinea flava]